MKRRSFFKVLPAVAAAPAVLAKMKSTYYSGGIIAFIKENVDADNIPDWSAGIKVDEWDKWFNSLTGAPLPTAKECALMGIHVERDRFGRPYISHPLFEQVLPLKES